MPVISTPEFVPPRFFKNRHLQTIYPAFFRDSRGVDWQRQRLQTPDNDFLDIDFASIGSDSVALLLHGLEGSSDSGYLKGMAHAFNQRGWDAVALNFRGCSGEPNRQWRSYHSGETSDPVFVLNYLLQQYPYQQAVVCGFSLGGNVTLKMLGEYARQLDPRIKAGAGISVPCDLGGAAITIGGVYSRRFLGTLLPKLKLKAEQHNRPFSPNVLRGIKTIKDFDNVYTSVAHGFTNADHYYNTCSSKNFIKDIQLPVLLVNALDDPFFSEGCYPFQQAEKSKSFYFLPTRFGGHVGFTHLNRSGEYWSEKVVTDFISQHTNKPVLDRKNPATPM